MLLILPAKSRMRVAFIKTNLLTQYCYGLWIIHVVKFSGNNKKKKYNWIGTLETPLLSIDYLVDKIRDNCEVNIICIIYMKQYQCLKTIRHDLRVSYHHHHHHSPMRVRLYRAILAKHKKCETTQIVIEDSILWSYSYNY